MNKQFEDFLKRLAPLVAYMPLETQKEILELVRETQRKLALAGEPLPASCVAEMTKAVPDDLVRAIVNDQRHGVGEPGWIKPSGPVSGTRER